MEGLYKVKIGEAQLNEAALATFGQPLASYAELADGWANTAYALTLADGRRAVLKARPPEGVRFMRCEIDTMKTEVDVLRLLQDEEGLPVPRLYAYDESREIVPVDYFIMSFVEGDSYNKVKDGLSDETRASIEEQLGRYTRTLNAVTGEKFGYYPDGAAKFDRWRDAFRAMIFGVLADGEEAGVELPMPYDTLRSEIESRLGVLDAVTVPRLVHWDLWDGNLFVKDGVVTGIVDFERARWADPLMEAYFGRFSLSPAYLRGYGLEKLDAAQAARRKLYDLYLDLILVIECTFRQYDNEGHLNWARDNLKDGLRRFLEPSAIG